MSELNLFFFFFLSKKSISPSKLFSFHFWSRISLEMINYDFLILLWDYCNLIIVFPGDVPVGPDHSAGEWCAHFDVRHEIHSWDFSEIKKMSTVSNRGELHLPEQLVLKRSGIPSRHGADQCVTSSRAERDGFMWEHMGAWHVVEPRTWIEWGKLAAEH